MEPVWVMGRIIMGAFGVIESTVDGVASSRPHFQPRGVCYVSSLESLYSLEFMASEELNYVSRLQSKF